MAIPINNHAGNQALGGATAAGLTPAELYGRLSKSMLAQNAGVQKLTAQLDRGQTRLSGLGQLQAALANFQSLAQSLSGTGLQTGATASVPAVLNAVTSAGAKPGTYEVKVQQLAQAQTLSARPVKSQDAAIGTGAATTIRIETGTSAGNSFTAAGSAKTIIIDSSNNSLQGIAAAFKAAGIDARVDKGAGGYTLQLAGQSGAAGSLRISVGGDAELQKMLSYNPAGLKGLTEGKQAQDALLSIDGKAVSSASNVVTGKIPGTALALATTGTTRLVVAQEAGAIAKNVGNFVSSFNALSARLRSLQQGELKADPALQQTQEQLSQLIERNQDGLARAGIALDRNGSLQVDAKALQAAVSADPDGVARLFTGGGQGVADQLDSTIAQLLGSGGNLSKEKTSVGRDVAAVANQKASITRAVSAQASALVARYAQVQGDANGAVPGMPGGGTSLFDFMA